MKKAEDIPAKEIKKVSSETEKNIALTLLELPTILEKSLESKSLNDLAEYLYNLTSFYNKFYAENKVLTEEDKEKQESWIMLTNLVYKVNTTLLDILGIKVPDKM